MRVEEYASEIFNSESGENASGYRERIIDSGPVREVEIIPVWKSRDSERKARDALTPEAIERINEQNAMKKAARLANCNFGPGDYAARFSYKTEPETPEEAQKHMRNFLRRVNRRRAQLGLPPAKYMYSTEWETPGGKRKKRIHHHIIMSGGMDRSEIENLWGHGYANTQQLQPDEHGITGKAMYIAKHPHKYRRWCASRGLEKPKVKEKPISAERVAKTAAAVEQARRIYERRFQNHRFVDVQVRYSKVVPGPYIYIRMIKEEPHESLHSRTDHQRSKLSREIPRMRRGPDKNGPPAHAHRRSSAGI